ncbi:MAG: hypothetical protein SF029_15945 [bacterium]|nr:hypothetical protein [bacterium]
MSWHSLYLPSTESGSIAEYTRAVLVNLGYEPYDPFGLLPGKGYSRSVRLFVAPPDEGWTRLLGSIDETALEPLLEALSQNGVCFSVHLENEHAQFRAFANGIEADFLEALTPHLRADKTADDLRRALSSTTAAGSSIRASADAVEAPPELLPNSVRQRAGSVNTRQVNKLFGRLMKQINRQTKGDEQAARALLAGDAPDWNSADGTRVRAVMACLPLTRWNQPDFVPLRDAYQLHVRRQRNPNAMLYPGDAEAMAAVPDALRYTPIYVGKQVW